MSYNHCTYLTHTASVVYLPCFNFPSMMLNGLVNCSGHGLERNCNNCPFNTQCCYHKYRERCNDRLLPVTDIEDTVQPIKKRRTEELGEGGCSLKRGSTVVLHHVTGTATRYVLKSIIYLLFSLLGFLCIVSVCVGV